MQTDTSLKILESGVDWLTVTAPWGEPTDKLIAQAEPLLHQSEGLGNRISKWAGNGYKGRACGEVSLGIGKEGSIVTLQSGEAYLSAHTFLGGGYRVTRLDMQATCVDESKMEDRWQAEYYALQCRKKKAGRPISSNLRLDSRGGSTLYLGSVKSDIIGRGYDKGIQKKIAQAGECQRYEVQFRREPAKLQAERLYQSEDISLYSAATVTRFFAARGIAVPRVEKIPSEHLNEYEALYTTRAASDEERCLKWLRTHIAPSVRRLIESGRREDVLRALGLREK